MLIPAGTSFRAEDFPSQQSWIPRLLGPLNSLILSLTTALNGNTTFGDNIPCVTLTLNFTYVASTDFPKTAKWSVTTSALGAQVTPPVEFRVCQATENGIPISIAAPAWSYNSQNQNVSFAYFAKITSNGTVAPLTVGSKYKIILRGQP